MSDIEQIQIKSQSRSPFDTAANKLRESFVKEAQSKIDAQLKKTIDAKKIFAAERAELQRLITDFESDKGLLADTLKDLA